MMKADAPPAHEHFREEDWLDFARQVGDAEHRDRVARHLEAGCPECEQTLRLWSAVLSVAEQEAAWPPPETAVQEVRRRFAGRRPASLRERIASQVALVFDSFRQPQLAGMRALGLASRQLLYKAGRYTIKLQLEPQAASERVSIVGQLLDEEDPEGTLRDIVVRALEGSRTLDRTLTNRLGEFHLEPDARDALQLSVDVPEIGTFTLKPPRGTEGAHRDAGDKAAGSSGRGKRARAR